MDDFLLPLLTVLIASVIGGAVTGLLEKYFRKSKGTQAPTPTEKLTSALDTLRRTASEMDGVIAEVATDIDRRQQALTELQSRSEALTAEEAALQKKIQHLQNIPVEVARYFQEINAANLAVIDKRSSRRDILFFILGVFVSVITAIVLNSFGI